MRNSTEQLRTHVETQSIILTRLLNSQSELQQLLRVRLSPSIQTCDSLPHSIATAATVATNSIVGIKAYVPTHQQLPCSALCKCTCHRVHKFKSSKSPHWLTGTLFVGYSGVPIGRLHKCTENTCLRRSPLSAYVHYIFPSWFVAEVLSLTLATASQSRISVSLTMRRVLSEDNSEAYRFVIQDNVGGLKELFSRGRATPNELYFKSGQSILSVSPVFLLLTVLSN